VSDNIAQSDQPLNLNPTAIPNYQARVKHKHLGLTAQTLSKYYC